MFSRFVEWYENGGFLVFNTMAIIAVAWMAIDRARLQVEVEYLKQQCAQVQEEK